MKRKHHELFARNARYLRELHKMSQEAVAERVGVTQKQIAKYESGRDWPNADVLVAYAKLFGLTLNQLLGVDPLLPPGRAIGQSRP